MKTCIYLSYKGLGANLLHLAYCHKIAQKYGPVTIITLCNNLEVTLKEDPLIDKIVFINKYHKRFIDILKLKKRITVGSLNTIRDYSWAPEIVKGVYYLTKIKPGDLMLSSGQGISGYEILKTAYKQINLDYRKYFSINKKFIRPNEVKVMMGSNKNYKILNKKFKYQIKTGGVKLVKKFFNSI